MIKSKGYYRMIKGSMFLYINVRFFIDLNIEERIIYKILIRKLDFLEILY